MDAYSIVFLVVTALALLTALDLPAGESLRQQEVWTLTPSSGNHPLIITHQIWSSGFLFPPVSAFIILSSVGAAAACFHTTSVITKHYTHTHTHTHTHTQLRNILNFTLLIYTETLFTDQVSQKIYRTWIYSLRRRKWGIVMDYDSYFVFFGSFCSSFLPVLMTLLVKS